MLLLSPSLAISEDDIAAADEAAAPCAGFPFAAMSEDNRNKRSSKVVDRILQNAPFAHDIVDTVCRLLFCCNSNSESKCLKSKLLK